MMCIFTPQQPVQLEIRPTFDWRIRIERRLDRDFSGDVNDNRTDMFNRFRPGITVKYGKNWSGELQYQLAHDEIWRINRTSSDEASDLNLAYVKHKDAQAEVTVGRQKINIGTERLIGSLEWSMTGRSFDGIRVKAGRWDAFAFKVGVAFPKPGRTRIVGSTYTSGYGLTSLIFKHDDQSQPSTDVWTLSHLWQQKKNAWTSELEGALQTGRASGKSLRAWAIHGGVGYAFNKVTRGTFEVNAASGGGNADTSFTFDNLLPTNHKFYGSMDLQSWRNMEEIALGIEHQLNPKWNLKASWHNFSLRDASDAWYGAGGGPNSGRFGAFIDSTGQSGRNLGSELDFEVGYKANPRVSASAGISLFSPGGFVKARNGGNADRQTWAFAMLSIKF